MPDLIVHSPFGEHVVGDRITGDAVKAVLAEHGDKVVRVVALPTGSVDTYGKEKPASSHAEEEG